MTDDPRIRDYRLPETDDELLAECDVHVFRSSGPGGQSVNTTDSAVRLVHRPTGIVVISRRERSQLRNKRDGIQRLRERIVQAQRVRAPRKPTKASKGAHQRRLAAKKVVAAKKLQRRRPASED